MSLQRRREIKRQLRKAVGVDALVVLTLAYCDPDPDLALLSGRVFSWVWHTDYGCNNGSPVIEDILWLPLGRQARCDGPPFSSLLVCDSTALALGVFTESRPYGKEDPRHWQHFCANCLRLLLRAEIDGDNLDSWTTDEECDDESE